MLHLDGDNWCTYGMKPSRFVGEVEGNWEAAKFQDDFERVVDVEEEFTVGQEIFDVLTAKEAAVSVEVFE